MTKASLVLASLAAVAVLVLPACGGDDGSEAEGTARTGAESPEETRYRIGFVLPGLEIEGIKRLAEGAEEAAEELNVDLRIGASLVAEEQVSAGQSYVSGGVDLLGLDPIDGTALASVAEAANAADIPVVTVISPVPTGEVVTHVSPSYTEAGELIGEAIVEFCAGLDPCRIAVLQGNPADAAGRAEYEGAKSVYSKAPNIEVVADQPTDWDATRALNVATDVLTANAEVDVFWAPWEGGTMATLEAIRAAGREGDGIGLFSFGGIECPYIKEMVDGNAHHNIFVAWPDVGRLFVETAVKILDGESVPDVVDVPLHSLDSTEVRQILDGEMEADPFVEQQIRRASEGCN